LTQFEDFFVLNIYEFWLYKIDDMAGGKPKFAQITGGESTLNFVIWYHEGPKPENLQITRLESKQIFLQWVNQKSLILRG